MRINVEKTKLIVVKRDESKLKRLMIKSKIVKKVGSFKYLGLVINTKLDCDKKI